MVNPVNCERRIAIEGVTVKRPVPISPRQNVLGAVVVREAALVERAAQQTSSTPLPRTAATNETKPAVIATAWTTQPTSTDETSLIAIAWTAHPTTDSEVPPESATVMPPTNIYRAAIEAARAELQRRDKAATEEEGGAAVDVVIAANVTEEEFNNVPDEWLRGLKVRVRADGGLIAVELVTTQHERVHHKLVAQVDMYAEANKLESAREERRHLGPRGFAMPDVELCTDIGDPRGDRVALALFEVEVEHRTGPEMIKTAAEYLTYLETVQCVIFIKFYHPREPYLSQVDSEVLMPALALEIRRGTGTLRVLVGGVEQELRRVRITQSRSFGNAGISSAAIRPFKFPHAHELLENPFDDALNRLPPHLFEPSPKFPRAIHTRNFVEELDAAVQTAQNYTRNDAEFRIRVLPDGPVLQVDLVRLFYQAMDGWWSDRRAAPPAVPTQLVPVRRGVRGLWDCAWRVVKSVFHSIIG